MADDEFHIAPIAPPRASETAPSFTELAKASARQENELVAGWDYAARGAFPRDPNFALSTYFQKRPDLTAFQDRFEDVQSEAEAQAMEGRIKGELRDRATVEAAGMAGFFADMASIVASPSTYLPVGGTGRGVARVGRMALLAGGAAGAHEGIMQATQETRTPEESRSAMLGSAILGGVLGSAVGMLSRAEFDAAARMVLDEPHMTPVRTPYNPSLDRSIGALEVGGVRMTDPGQLRGVLSAEETGSATFRQRVAALAKQAIGGEDTLTQEQRGTATASQRLLSKSLRTLGYASPVARNLLSRFPKIRGVQAQLADAGLYYKEGVVAAPGQTAEARIRFMVETHEAKAVHILNDAYGEYYFGRKATGILERGRAEIGGLVPMGGRLTRRQFSEQVFIEAQEAAPGAIPQVKAAAEALRSQFYDPIFKQMKEVGLIAEDVEAEDLMGELAYITHVYQRDAIVRNPEAFHAMIRKSYQRQMENEYGRRIAALEEAKATDEADIADMVRPAEEVEALKAELEAERAAFRDSSAATLADRLRMVKYQLARLKTDRETRASGELDIEALAALAKKEKQLKGEQATIEGALSAPEAAAAVKKDKALARRLRVLSGSKAALSRRQEKLFERIEAADEEAITVLRGVASSIAKMNAELEGMSPAAFKAAKADLKREIGAAKRRLRDLDKKSDEIEGDLNLRRAEGEEDPALFNQDQAKVLQGRLRATKRLDEAEEVLDDLDPVGAPAVLKEWQDDVITDTADRLRRVADRRAALVERAKAADPATVDTRIAETRAGAAVRGERLVDWVNKQGGEMDGDRPDFTEGGNALAKDVAQRVIGNPVNVVGLDLTAEMGAEKARVLNIPLSEKMPWLETDMDKLVKIYARSVLPGIELSRSGFGVNGAKALEEVNKVFDVEEARIAGATVEDLPGGGPKQRKGEGEAEYGVRQEQALTAWKQKANESLLKERHNTMRAFTGQFQRLRHQRAIPQDPDAFLYRAGRVLSQWNVLNFMGNVAPAQLTDPALAVARLGVRRIFSHAVKPLVGSFKDLRMTQREALYMGLDEMQTQARLYQMSDLLEDAGMRKSKGEQAVEWAANKMGIVAGFTPMNQMVRQVLTPAVVGKLFDAMEVIHAGKPLHGVTVRNATDILATANLDGDMVSRIWAMRDEGGIINHNGLWVPNTESWTDAGARDAFRNAAMAEMDKIIIVPGLERPLFVDANMGMKLLTQFQSFMWSAHTKVLMAGLQKRDFDVATAFVAAIPLAALSTYVVMVAQGRGQEALDWSWEEWADEITSRHPMVGALSLGLKVGQEIPATRPYLQFSDRGSERRLSSGLVGAVAGPSYTTINRGAKFVSELDDPTQSTVHTARQLTPYNQIFYARWLFDKIEAESGQALPKTRAVQ